MFNLIFQVKNPFKVKGDYKSLYEKIYNLSANKGFEFQISKYNYFLIECQIDISIKGSDHAGPEINFGILGLCCRAKLYDKRHWDYINNKWEKYEDIDSKTNR